MDMKIGSLPHPKVKEFTCFPPLFFLDVGLGKLLLTIVFYFFSSLLREFRDFRTHRFPVVCTVSGYQSPLPCFNISLHFFSPQKPVSARTNSMKKKVCPNISYIGIIYLFSSNFLFTLKVYSDKRGKNV